MAQYTMELRTIIENGYNIFDFPYQFYDEEQRLKFQEHFIKHFYFREIGCDTIDRFKWYLEDKFNLLMPYYNELFVTALIEYDKKFNYDVTETHETTRDTKGKSKQEKYAVGQFSGENESETEGNKNVHGTQNNLTESTDSITENGTSKTETSETVNNETTGTDETTNKSTETGSQKEVNKFMDTPQGLTDLTDTNYLTNLTDNEKNNSNTVEGEVNKVTSGTSKTTSSGSSETENNNTVNSEGNNLFTGENEEQTQEKYNSKSTDSQKTTFDDNTRNETDESQIEKTTRRMYGNIGIQTASDIITKHIELQQILKKIELMFFDECEDLFMLVY